ncbi:MAG: multicopper oxidase family protein [Pseudomonadota bacterium]
MGRHQINRRTAIGVIGAGAGLVPLGLVARRGWAQEPVRHDLTIQHVRFQIADAPTDTLVSAQAEGPPPVLRLKQGVPFVSTVTNRLDTFSTMHWHGIRLENGMDGVPYLTQPPFGQDESFEYRFTSADAGSYWYHPHCMTMDLMAMGLTGVLIVDEAEDPGFDSEVVLNLRDFRLRPNGEWLDLWTPRGAARGGTYGTVLTANWLSDPVYEAKAGGVTRLRLAATDTTRIYRPYVTGAAGQVIAADGHPLRVAMPWPSEAEPALLSPGQRLEMAIEMPRQEGALVDVMTDFPGGPRRLARIRAAGPDLGRALADVAPLPMNDVPEPDLENARLEEFVFGWTPEGGAPNNGFCGTLGFSFWSINRIPWPGDAASPSNPGFAPLATFKQGESVVLRLRNESPNRHPIHLHGLVFRPLRSNKRVLPSNWTDTVLLLQEETIEVALVADNPGDWAFHCHVIEHQKTGLAGFIRVLA